MSYASTDTDTVSATSASARSGSPSEPRAAPGTEVDLPPPSEQAAAICPRSGLPCENRCLLYVGGRVRLCRYYRALAEQNGWSFIHHDGGLEAGLSRLAAVLTRADTVICPVDCVSHGAMQRVRHFCKQTPTQLVLLRSASLSAFAKALERLPAANHY